MRSPACTTITCSTPCSRPRTASALSMRGTSRARVTWRWAPRSQPASPRPMRSCRDRACSTRRPPSSPRTAPTRRCWRWSARSPRPPSAAATATCTRSAIRPASSRASSISRRASTTRRRPRRWFPPRSARCAQAGRGRRCSNARWTCGARAERRRHPSRPSQPPNRQSTKTRSPRPPTSLPLPGGS